MSVLVKDMKMPTTGLYFVSVDNTGGRDKTIMTVERMLGNRDVRQIVGLLELVSIPPHGRLGDLDILRKKLETICDRYDAGIISKEVCVNLMLQAVISAPTIIPAEEE